MGARAIDSMRACGAANLARRPIGRVLIAVLVAVGLFLVAGGARAGGLSADERARLHRGELVKRELEYDFARGRYVGGVSYAVVQAPTSAVLAALGDVGALRAMLPLAVSTKEVGRRGRDTFITVTHGGRLGTATYTMRVRREGRGTIRFWLDRSRPHGLEDAWGYFRVTPFGENASLVTYGALMDLGSGLVQLFFEDRVRELALGTPVLVRRYVEERAPATRVAALRRSR